MPKGHYDRRTAAPTRVNGTTHTNGNGNGNGPITQRRLETLLASLEQDAASVRRSLELLRHGQVTTKVRRVPSMLESAAALDSERVERVQAQAPVQKQKPRGGPGAAGGRYGKRARHSRRLASKRLLDRFNDKTALKGKFGHSIGSLVRRGYLTRSDDGGYLRTGKVFAV